MALEHEEALMELSQQCIEASHKSADGEFLEKAGIAIQLLSRLWTASEQRHAELVKVPGELIDGICALSRELQREPCSAPWARIQHHHTN